MRAVKHAFLSSHVWVRSRPQQPTIKAMPGEYGCGQGPNNLLHRDLHFSNQRVRSAWVAHLIPAADAVQQFLHYRFIVGCTRPFSCLPEQQSTRFPHISQAVIVGSDVSRKRLLSVLLAQALVGKATRMPWRPQLWGQPLLHSIECLR